MNCFLGGIIGKLYLYTMGQCIHNCVSRANTVIFRTRVIQYTIHDPTLAGYFEEFDLVDFLTHVQLDVIWLYIAPYMFYMVS